MHRLVPPGMALSADEVRRIAAPATTTVPSFSILATGAIAAVAAAFRSRCNPSPLQLAWNPLRLAVFLHVAIAQDIAVETSRFDLIVVGAGSGGVRAARMAAATGARVAIIEGRFFGGTCVNVGCIPKKLLVYGAHVAEQIQQARGYGWQIDTAQFDWQQLLHNKNREIERLNGVYERLLHNAGVTIIRGWGQLNSDRSISVDGKQFAAERILIATGGKPIVPAFSGSEHCCISDDVFFLERLPRSVVIIGGGYIAVEFAGIFENLGVETHIVHRGGRVLKSFDSECVEFLQKQMTHKGIRFHFNTSVSRITVDNERKTVQLDDGTTITSDLVLAATGRRAELGFIEASNLDFARNADGSLHIDSRYQTSQPGIFALGDVAGSIELTPVALAQAMHFVSQQFGKTSHPPQLDRVPTAIFTQPSFASVGLSEDEARSRGHDVAIFSTDFRALKLTLTDDTQRTFMKLVVDLPTDRVLGAHMVGEEAGEIIQGLAVAINAGATKADFDRTIGIHPTAAEEFVTLRQRTR